MGDYKSSKQVRIHYPARNSRYGTVPAMGRCTGEVVSWQEVLADASAADRAGGRPSEEDRGRAGGNPS